MDFQLETGLQLAADYLPRGQYAEVEQAFRTRPASMLMAIDLGAVSGVYSDRMIARLMLEAARQAASMPQA